MLRLFERTGGCTMRNYLIPAMILSSVALGTAPAVAQSSARSGAIEGRVDRLEGEMRAVQRKVFPGGSGQYVQPDNQPTTPENILPNATTSPVADLTTRVDSLETQLRSMVGQIEANQHKLQGLESRLKALEANAAAAPSPVVSQADTPGVIERPTPARPAVDKPIAKPVPTPVKPVPVSAIDKPTATKSAVAKPATDPARGARLAAVDRPETGDVAEDTYLYGYRLWTAKLYPEAEVELKTVATKYATHKRASYAQNLLGRSYLDDGKPSLASLAFYDSYKNWPDGDRAPESLYYLAQSLVKLDKPAAQVCKVYTELTRTYGAKVDADPKMKAGVAKGKAASGCQ